MSNYLFSGPPPAPHISLGSYPVYPVGGYMPPNQYTGWHPSNYDPSHLPSSYDSGPPVFQPPLSQFDQTGYDDNDDQHFAQQQQQQQKQQQEQQKIETDEELAMLGIDPEDLTGFGN